MLHRGYATARAEFEPAQRAPESFHNMPGQPTHNLMHQQPGRQVDPAGSSNFHGGWKPGWYLGDRPRAPVDSHDAVSPKSLAGTQVVFPNRYDNSVKQTTPTPAPRGQARLARDQMSMGVGVPSSNTQGGLGYPNRADPTPVFDPGRPNTFDIRGNTYSDATHSQPATYSNPATHSDAPPFKPTLLWPPSLPVPPRPPPSSRSPIPQAYVPTLPAPSASYPDKPSETFTGGGPENPLRRGPAMGTFRAAGVQQHASTQPSRSVSQAGLEYIAQRALRDPRLRDLLENEVGELESVKRNVGGERN